MTIGRHSFAERPKTRGPRAPKTAPLHIRSAALGNQCACARRTEARWGAPRPRSCHAPVRSRWPSCRYWFEASDRRPLREGAWRSRGGRGMPRNAMLSNRRCS